MPFVLTNEERNEYEEGDEGRRQKPKRKAKAKEVNKIMKQKKHEINALY
jgi:hypothetical protein